MEYFGLDCARQTMTTTLSPDWQKIFGSDRSLRVEIGPGKGQFLMECAQREPEANYVAVEIRKKRVDKINSKLARAELKNVHICLGNAKEMITSLFVPGSVEMFFIHFPDPWPKRRHESRRLVDSEFLYVLHELLLPGGKIYFTTDVKSYAQMVGGLFAAREGFRSVYYKVGECDSLYHRSIHERKFKLQNRKIYYFCYFKI